MARINFTASRIDAFNCDADKDQSFLWDEGCRWLALRATRNGAKAYIFQAKLHGKDIRVTIGSPDAWKIPDARARANELKVMVDKDIDPRIVAADVKQQAKAAADEKTALKLIAREAWNAYVTAHRSKWGEVHRNAHAEAAQEGGEALKHRAALSRPGPLASLLCLPLHDITADVVADWLQREAATRRTAAQNGFRKFRAFINWCAKQAEYKNAIQPDCCLADNVKDVVPPSLARRNDSLQKEQLALWFANVRECSPVMSAYLQALLLTGARRNEMVLLKWSDVDFTWKTMTLYDTEDASGERTIPLTPYVATLLDALPRKDDYIFASPYDKSGPIVNVTTPHRLALKRAKLPHITIHGLRRSFATLSEWLDTIPVGVVAQIMGHKPSAVAEKHYKQRSIDLLRMHHTKIEAWMLEQARITFAQDAAA